MSLIPSQDQIPASDLLEELRHLTPTKVMGEKSDTFSAATERFPEGVASNIKIFYAFVRVADDFVDATEDIETNAARYWQFKQAFWNALESGKKSGYPVIDEFIDLFIAYDFERQWVEDFFVSMEMDLEQKTHTTIEDIESYNHGAAGVIGYMCARIFGFDKEDTESYYAAHQLGFAFQYINFIRDILEDGGLNRNYFPLSDYPQAFLDAVEQGEYELVNAYNFALYSQQYDHELFAEFIRKQVARYQRWNQEGMQTLNQLVKFSPGVAIPVLVATILYQKACDQILEDPFIVLEGKIKPTDAEKTQAFVYAMIIVFFYGMNLSSLPRLLVPYLRAPQLQEG